MSTIKESAVLEDLPENPEETAETGTKTAEETNDPTKASNNLIETATMAGDTARESSSHGSHGGGETIETLTEEYMRRLEGPIYENPEDDEGGGAGGGGGGQKRRRSSKMTLTSRRSRRDNSSRSSSMELRRMPVDVLLKPMPMDLGSILSDDFASEKFEFLGGKQGCLHMLCLRPGFNLRNQLMLSFGTINFITTLFVVVICVAVATLAGNNIQNAYRDSFQSLTVDTQGQTARYLAESLTQRLLPDDMINILVEATQDRFAGYPLATDERVPFVDLLQNQSQYPLEGPPIPFEWEFNISVDDPSYKESYEEYFRGRKYFKTRAASPFAASFLMQGTCDPSVTDPMADSYWPNCTEANNNLTTGGLVAPNPTNEFVYRKSRDLVPLLRALFESSDDTRDLGLYFVNSGAGASVNYPHYTVSTQSEYVSSGCDWMKEPNPLDPSKPLGTQEMIDRCHKKDEVVSVRAYNPLERSWCFEQALYPDRAIALTGPDSWAADSDWILTYGRAVFDRETKEFIACTYAGMDLGVMDDKLKAARVTEGSEVTVVRWDSDGTVASSSILRETSRFNSTPLIDQLDVGMTKESYRELYNLVDYKSPWEPTEVRKQYEDFGTESGAYFVSGYPMPPIPDEYDETYRPLFLVIMSTPTEDVYQVVNDVNDVVNEKVRNVNIFTVLAGAVGLAVSTCIIFMMAHTLTFPLRKMNKVASDIVNNFGDPTKDGKINDPEKKRAKMAKIIESRCTPKTEISDVVTQFNKMVASFSGTAMVRSEQTLHQEVENLFALQDEFADLYLSRESDEFNYLIKLPNEQTVSVLDTHEFLNVGSNLTHWMGQASRASEYESKSHRNRRFSSPLFLWIVALIVTPLLVVNTVITAVVMHTINEKFSEGVETAEAFFVVMESQALLVHARLRADLLSSWTSRATNNLHVLTRYSSWLMFGGLKMKDGFTELVSAIEECTPYDDVAECPYVAENYVCDCEWNDERFACQNYDNPRDLQRVYFMLRSDMYEEVSNDNTTSEWLPIDLAKTRFEADWHEDPTKLPGWNSTPTLFGHSTPYERFRASSAVPLHQPLYNFDRTREIALGSFVGFGQDGSFIGYDGCNSAYHVLFGRWSSTEANKASKYRPDICPDGAYGYDSRCRGWFDTGMKEYHQNDSFLHITSPYQFAGQGTSQGFAQSATAPIVDPWTGEHVGQTILDMKTSTVFATLDANQTQLAEGGFAIVITAITSEDDDTVVGPGFSLSENARPISTVVLPNDQECESEECTQRKLVFDEIVDSMKSGDENYVTFTRIGDHDREETIHMAFSPVNVDSFKQINSSDYSRGVEVSSHLVFSLGLAQTEDGMLLPFDAIEEETQKQIRIAIGLLSALLLLSAFFVIYISHHLTTSITEPMLYLLELIRSINSTGVDKDPPTVRKVRASKEIVVFSQTLEMLYKIVRSANTAFHAGELEVTYHVLVDALRLFRRLDNKKAIGIATNNLGNTMLGMYQEMKSNNLTIYAGLSRKQVVSRGMNYYHEAIRLGEKAYDEFYVAQGWTPICLDFMQHLSNRYFNRGLFLLVTKDDSGNPRDMIQQGLRDLQIAKDMDAEVLSYGEEIGWGASDRAEKLFNVKVGRARGFNLLLGLGFKDEWDMDEFLDETFDQIKEELRREESSQLFIRVSVAGRMQEIETELMKYKRIKGDLKTAAQIAIRILEEDQLVFAETQFQAVDTLLKYVDSDLCNFEENEKGRVNTQLLDYLDYLEDAVKEHQSTTMNDLDSDIVSKATNTSNGVSKQSKARSSNSWSLRQSNGGFVTMEDF